MHYSGLWYEVLNAKSKAWHVVGGPSRGAHPSYMGGSQKDF